MGELERALLGEEKDIYARNPWLAGAGNLQQTSFVNPEASLGSNILASALQGLGGGLMQGYGQKQAGEGYADLLNKAFTVDEQTQTMVPALGMEEGLQNPELAKIYQALSSDKTSRQRSVSDALAMRGQEGVFDLQGNVKELGYLKNPEVDAQIKAMQNDLKSMESLMPAPADDDLVATLGTMRDPYEARQWIKNKHQQNQARLRMLGTHKAEKVPEDVRTATDMAVTINNRMAPLMKIAARIKATPGWKGKEWTVDNIMKLIPASERAVAESWLKVGAMEAAIRQHGGGRQLSENEGQIMIDFFAGSGGMVTGDLVRRLEYMQDGIWHKGISSLANAMAEGPFKVNALKRANSIYKQMDLNTRTKYKDLLYMNWEGAESTAFPQPAYTPEPDVGVEDDMELEIKELKAKILERAKEMDL